MTAGARVTIRRAAPGRWRVQVWSPSGRHAHTWAETTTGPEAIALVASGELARLVGAR